MSTLIASDAGLFTGWSRFLAAEDDLEERNDQNAPVQDIPDLYQVALRILNQQPATLSTRQFNR